MTDALGKARRDHEDWLTVERGLAPNTRAAYRRDLARYEAFVRDRGRHDPATIDAGTVYAYVEQLSTRGDDDGERLAAASIARALVAIRSFHRFCADEGIAETDVTERVATPRVPQGIPKALGEREIEALLGAVTGDDPLADRDRAILELLYGSGLRISELVGLDVDAIDLDDAMLRVFGKGAKERLVPIGRRANDAIARYLRDARPVLRNRRSRGRAEADATFLNARGGRLTRQACWKLVHDAGVRAGLGERLSPHVLRHSCATHMLDHGADIRVVQELLGHASVSTTQVYTKVSPERLRAVYDAAHPRAHTRV